MSYTYIVPHEDLDELDELLARVRVAQHRPRWRHRLLSGSAYPLRLSELRILRAVERCPRGSISDVAEDLAIEHSTASRAVAEAVGAGLLVRSVSSEDRRRTSLQLTEKGQQILAATTERRREMVAEVVVDWMPSDIARLNELLRRFADDMDAEQS